MHYFFKLKNSLKLTNRLWFFKDEGYFYENPTIILFANILLCLFYTEHNPVSFMRENLFLIYNILHIVYVKKLEIQLKEKYLTVKVVFLYFQENLSASILLILNLKIWDKSVNFVH